MPDKHYNLREGGRSSSEIFEEAARERFVKFFSGEIGGAVGEWAKLNPALEKFNEESAAELVGILSSKTSLGRSKHWEAVQEYIFDSLEKILGRSLSIEESAFIASKFKGAFAPEEK